LLIVSEGLSMINHFLWLQTFLKGHEWHWTEVAACFGLLVWTVPLAFVAISTTVATLPAHSDLDNGKRKRINALHGFLRQCLSFKS
jgi:hypothetical protein